MLLRMDTLEAIRDGGVSVVFRRWKRPTVQAGGTLLTALGELEIRDVREVAVEDITPADARAAGFDGRDELLAVLAERPDATLYRIDLGALRPDPRAALRQDHDLATEEKDEVVDKLRGMDARSRSGPWTGAVLRLIADRPGTRAADLAAELGMEKDGFKRNVRKLKRLGLTESLEVGYRLSPRGTVVLEHLE